MGIVFLGWFGPLIGAVQTSDIYKVLKASDNMGGACDDRLTEVNNMADEVQKLVGAAIDAIDVILKSPLRAATKDQRKNRERILLLARQFYGVNFNTKFNILNPTQFLKLDDDGKTTMTNVRSEIHHVPSYFVPYSHSKVLRLSVFQESTLRK